MSDELLPKFEPGPVSAEDGIRRLISRFGKEAVMAAVRQATKAKRGRKAEKDWLLLRPYIEQDAADWIEGRDPFKLRSSYSIANEIAAESPGHSQPATARRILKKLSARRRWFVLSIVWQRSESGYPYGVHLRALKALKALPENKETFGSLLGYAEADVQRYRERLGDPPAEMTMAEIKEATNNALMQFVQPRNALSGLGALLGIGAPKA